MVSSILHRATGVIMSLGLILLVAWVTAAASGAESFAFVADGLQTLIGKLFLVGLSLAFFYHLANGIRHLVWDAGYGFEKRQATASAWFVLAATAVLAAIFWAVAL
jgi:succinate dehydrogenase / fumarate reductase cytochrome b subunit